MVRSRDSLGSAATLLTAGACLLGAACSGAAVPPGSGEDDISSSADATSAEVSSTDAASAAGATSAAGPSGAGGSGTTAAAATTGAEVTTGAAGGDGGAAGTSTGETAGSGGSPPSGVGGAGGSSGEGGAAPCRSATELPLTVEGDTQLAEHACGYACDTDWCSCEACVVADGPEVVLSAGEYIATWAIFPSQPMSYELEVVDVASGDVIASETTTISGYTEQELPFEVGDVCNAVRLRITSSDDTCSRLYDVTVSLD